MHCRWNWMQCRWIAQTIYQNNKTEYSELLDTKIWNSKRSRARKVGRRTLWYRNISLFKTNLSQMQIWEYMRDLTEWTLWVSTAEASPPPPQKKKQKQKKTLPPLIIFYCVYFEKNELAFIGNTYKKHNRVNAIRATSSVLFNYSFGMTVAFEDRPLQTLPIIHSALISEHPF